MVSTENSYLHADSRFFDDAYFGQGSQQQDILLDNVRCSGNELRLIDCPARPILDHDCGHHEDAGVRCKPSKIIWGHAHMTWSNEI